MMRLLLLSTAGWQRAAGSTARCCSGRDAARRYPGRLRTGPRPRGANPAVALARAGSDPPTGTGTVPPPWRGPSKRFHLVFHFGVMCCAGRRSYGRERERTTAASQRCGRKPGREIWGAGGPDPRSRRLGVPAKPVGFVGWGTPDGAYSTYAQGGAQKLAWGSPLAGNGAPEMGRMSPKDPGGLFGRSSRPGDRKPRRLSPVRPTTPRPATPPRAPDLRPASASEQKLNQFRKRRYDALHGETEAIRKRRDQGKPDARQRIQALVDPDSFVELDMFATARATGLGMEDRRAAGDGAVVGFGTIDGRDVAVYAFDPTVLGGSLGEVTAEKIVKAQELALRSRIPIIGINDSGGARIHEGVAALAGYASI